MLISIDPNASALPFCMAAHDVRVFEKHFAIIGDREAATLCTRDGGWWGGEGGFGRRAARCAAHVSSAIPAGEDHAPQREPAIVADIQHAHRVRVLLRVVRTVVRTVEGRPLTVRALLGRLDRERRPLNISSGVLRIIRPVLVAVDPPFVGLRAYGEEERFRQDVHLAIEDDAVLAVEVLARALREVFDVLHQVLCGTRGDGNAAYVACTREPRRGICIAGGVAHGCEHEQGHRPKCERYHALRCWSAACDNEGRRARARGCHHGTQVGPTARSQLHTNAHRVIHTCFARALAARVLRRQPNL